MVHRIDARTRIQERLGYIRAVLLAGEVQRCEPLLVRCRDVRSSREEGPHLLNRALKRRVVQRHSAHLISCVGGHADGVQMVLFAYTLIGRFGRSQAARTWAPWGSPLITVAVRPAVPG